MSIKDEKIIAVLRDLAARFLSEHGNGSSLITVTSAELSGRGKYATIFFTVFPEEHEKTALEFARRKRSEFKRFVMDSSRIGIVPQIDFAIDQGEKNRQRIDTILGT